MQTRETTTQAPRRLGVTTAEAVVIVAAALALAAGAGGIAYAVWQSLRPREVAGPIGATSAPATDAAPVVCEETGRFDTGLAKSRGIAAGPDATWYVAGDQAVRVFDSAGKKLREIDVGEAPAPLAVATDGTLYLATRDRILVYDDAGKRRAAWPSAGDKALLTSLAVTRDHVFVADAGNRVVRRYDRAGKLLGTLGRKDLDRNVPGLIVPSPYLDIAAGPDGLLRVTNPGRRHVETYTPAGDLEMSWGEYGRGAKDFAGCCNPAHLAVIVSPESPERVEAIVTCEKGLTRVKLHDIRGRLIGLVAGPEQFAEHDRLLAGKPSGYPFSALDVAVDPAGRIAILDPVTQRVRLFRRLGRGTSQPGARP